MPRYDRRRWAVRRFDKNGNEIYTAVRFITKVEAKAYVRWHMNRYGILGDTCLLFERLWQSTRHLKNAIDRWKWDNYNAEYGPDYLRD